MRKVNWWNVKLVKWVDSSVINVNENIQQDIDNLILDFNDVGWEEEQKDEEIRVVKPQQYNLELVCDRDRWRREIDIDYFKTNPIEQNLDNNHIVYSKFHYNLIDSSQRKVITYSNKINNSSDLGIMFWINPINEQQWERSNRRQVHEWRQITDNIYIRIEANKWTGLRWGSNEYELDINTDDWYAIYLGNNTVDNKSVFRVWNKVQNSSRLNILYESFGDIVLEDVISIYTQSSSAIASIRYLTKNMLPEEQQKSFNRLIFREDDLAYIIDDCYPISFLGNLSNR